MAQGRPAAIGWGLALWAMLTAGAAAEPRLQVLDAVDIPKTGVEGEEVTELSGLAWDGDAKLLYAVSDAGVLHRFRLTLAGDRIQGVEHVSATPISAPMGEGMLENAEGLAAVAGDNGLPDDTELLVAFEDGPAIARFMPDGTWIANVALPEPLADPANYAKKNSRLESVAFEVAHGVLTAPERPLRGEPPSLHKIYATDGATWAFKAAEPDGRIKAIETLASGNLLVLERTETEGGERAAHLRYLDLAQCAANVECTAPDLAVSPDPRLIDNFEGMTRLSDDLFLIVTDRRKKDVEATRLVLFKLVGAQ